MSSCSIHLYWLFSPIFVHHNDLKAWLNHLLQRCLSFATFVLPGYLDILLGYQTFNLWVLPRTRQKGGQVLFAQYDDKYRCLEKQSDSINANHNHKPYNEMQGPVGIIVIFSFIQPRCINLESEIHNLFRWWRLRNSFEKIIISQDTKNADF